MEAPHSNWAIDRLLFLMLMLLYALGLVQVFSSSYILASDQLGDGLHYFRRQLVFTGISLLMLLCFARVPWNWLKTWGWLSWPVSIFLVALTFVPGIRHSAGGAARWINLPGGFHFEPSEFLKIGFAIWLATLLDASHPVRHRLAWWMKPLTVVMPPLLLLRQPDFGSFAILAALLLLVLFSVGMRWSYVVGLITTGGIALFSLVWMVPYRRARLEAFLDPWKDLERGGFQVVQSLLGFHAGGITGVGLGEGQAKLFFLPEAHTDFTLSVFAEETGWIGLTLLFLIYFSVILRGLAVASRVRSPFSHVLVLSLILLFSLQVFVNAAVALGVLPTKGLTLPFMSYGGSSLVMMGVLFGLCLGAFRDQERGAAST